MGRRKINSVLNEVLKERIHQDTKWGEQNHPDGVDQDGDYKRATLAKWECESDAEDGSITWRVILNEEMLEAFAETDQAKLRAELIQVAAVAVAWVEAIDRRPKP